MSTAEPLHPNSRTRAALFVIVFFCYLDCASAATTVTRPYNGVTRTVTTITSPRNNTINVLQIDLTYPGVSFKLSPAKPPLPNTFNSETSTQTTLAYLNQENAQFAINVHYFDFPAQSNTGTNLTGFAASLGTIYSAFDSAPTLSYAIVPNSPVLNIDANNVAVIAQRGSTDTSLVVGAAPLAAYNSLCGSAQIITSGVKTLPTVPDKPTGTPPYQWYTDTTQGLAERTIIGLSQDGHTLIIFTVDKTGANQGLTVSEAADFLISQFSVFTALNLDGGGSTTLAMRDPTTQVGSVVSGATSGGQRAVGSNLAVFAPTAKPDMGVSSFTHSPATFTQGQTGNTYSIVARNVGAASTAGTITATINLPSGLTATSFTGTGWTQTSLSPPTATFSGTLAAATSANALTLTVNVSGNATSPLVPSVSVSGGGQTNTLNDTASDTTTVLPTNLTWSGGSGTWAVGAGGWDLGNWVDGKNAVIGTGADTAGNITVNSTVSPANVTFNSAQSGTYTLTVNGSIASGAAVTAGAGTVIRGNGGAIHRTIQTTSTSVLWPGAAAVGSAVPAGGESLSVDGLEMSGGGKLKIALNTSTANSTQKLIVAGNCTIGGTLSLGIPEGSAGANVYTVLTSANPLSGTFSTVLLNGATVTGTAPVNVQYMANSVTVTLTGGVSPVKLEDFKAESMGAGVLVSWIAVSEFQNLGFNVYRRAGLDWVRVNPSLIPGRITNPDEKTYTYYDWPGAGEWQYKLESIGASGEKEMYEGVGVTVDWSNTTDVSLEALASAKQSLVVAASVRNAEMINAKFSNWRSDLPVAQTNLLAAGEKEAAASSPHHLSPTHHPSASARWFSSGPVATATAFAAAKVVYDKPGVLFVPQAMLPGGFNAGNVAIQREGRNLPALALIDGGLLVYAPGYEDEYTNKDALFLRATASPTQAGRPASAAGLFESLMPVNGSTPATATLDFHDVYYDFNLRPYTFAPWFSAKYLTAGTAQDFTLNLPQACGGAATLTINLWSLTESHHALQVLVNSVPVGEAAWDLGGRMMQLSINVPSGVLLAGDNAVSLATPPGDGTDTQLSLLHSLSASYTRGLDGSTPFEITNPAATAQLFEVSHVPSAKAWVVDTRFAERAALVPIETWLDASGSYRVRFVASPGGKYLVVPAGRENTPLSVTKRHVAPLRVNGPYLATGPAQFSPGVQPLLLKHAKEGLRGMFADQEQLFDYYNSGRYGPGAIQSAVRATRPQYLLLLGRTIYDYKNYSGANVDPLCPAFLVPTSFWAQATSDSQFGDLGRGYPEVAIGRLPVNDPSELSAAVSRIATYTGAPASGARVHAAADMQDPAAGNFGQQLASLAQSHPDLAWQANTLGETYPTAPEVNAALTVAANGGADIILYNGHGNSVRLGKTAPRILDTDLVGNWNGNVVFLQSTCTANWMAKDETGFKSIAIQALTQPQGGISASIGTSTYMNADVAMAFMNQLLKNTGTNARWGTALLKAQQWAGAQSCGGFYGDLMKTEQLFGDPALRIFAQPQNTPAHAGSAVDAGKF